MSGTVPYGELALKARSGEGRRQIEQTLLAAAGFLPGANDRRRLDRASWHLFRVRPQNHPARRIVGYSYVLAPFLQVAEGPSSDAPDWAGGGLAEGFARLLMSEPKESLEHALMGVGPPSQGSHGRRRPGAAPIGRGRAGDMAVNCVLPFFHSLSRKRGESEVAQRALELYRGFPRLQENELTREMWEQLFRPMPEAFGGEGEGGDQGRCRRVVSGARRQQGLLHLHRLASSPVASSTGA